MSRGLKLLSSMATRKPLAELCARFAAQHGIAVAAEAAGGVDVAKRIRAGEAADIVALASDVIDTLVGESLLRADSRADLARSLIAAAVPAADAAVDISTAEALRAAVLATDSIGYSTGPSGNHLLQLFGRWGILPGIQSRLRIAPPGVPVAQFIAERRCSLGFQQASELQGQPGIRLLGGLPADCQQVTVFAAAVGSATQRLPEARALLGFLHSSAAAPVWEVAGLLPLSATV